MVRDFLAATLRDNPELFRKIYQLNSPEPRFPDHIQSLKSSQEIGVGHSAIPHVAEQRCGGISPKTQPAESWFLETFDDPRSRLALLTCDQLGEVAVFYRSRHCCMPNSGRIIDGKRVKEVRADLRRGTLFVCR